MTHGGVITYASPECHSKYLPFWVEKFESYQLVACLVFIQFFFPEKSRLECMLNERRNRRRYLEQEREAGTLCIKKKFNRKLM